ncbi:chaperonin 10-like protein [Diplogelasinospora grovesii]|uniref:Chaperonin 10-like protein n=1 Tax=Diplogelasinospora grovesii TaxID=303347 RepID=A0AAN6NE31_9PEZI|nr:chaperonin 10-like protein [Diplogelasinospora grovesii]
MSTTTITSSSEKSQKSRGQYLHEPKALKLEARDLAPLAADNVRIAIRSTTICGSDVHYYTHFANGNIQVREALCLGHEAAGQVAEVGSSASEAAPGLKMGDAVALECGVPCGQCAHCRSGRYNVCPDLRFRSSGSKFPHYQGTLQEFVDHPARWVHRLPPELDFEAGALLEPLAVAIHAARRAGPDAISPRRACLVFGAGAVGLLCAVAARAEGCRDVVMVDIDEGRLGFALEHGFASVVHAVKPRRGGSLQEKLDIARETATEIGELKWPDGEPVGRVQRTFECTGAESCLQSSIYATASGGSVILVGMGIPNHTLPVSELTTREINLVATWRYAGAYPRAIEIAKASVTGSPVDGNALPDISQMITHRFNGLDVVQEALEMARKTRDADGKLVVKTVVDF